MSHWCKDIQRDEAVRAAEDGRTGPLPTLKEAISRAGQLTPSEVPQEQNCTERGNGLRTERITLEITHDLDAPLGHWIVQVIDESLGYDESVRVVEEVHFDDLANMSLERDAAIRERDELRDDLLPRVAKLEEHLKSAPAASGAAGKSVGSELAGRLSRFADRVEAGEIEMPKGPPKAPQPAPGWLTAEERKWIEYMESNCVLPYAGMKCMEAILARSSPPEVVLPVSTIGRGERYDGDWVEGWIACRERCAAALAAAGVTVKEVEK